MVEEEPCLIVSAMDEVRGVHGGRGKEKGKVM